MDAFLWVDSAFKTKAKKGEQCSKPFLTHTAPHVYFNVSLLMFPLVLKTYTAQILNRASVLMLHSVDYGL